MNTSPLVTVVVPAYNADAYVAEALESVRSQSHEHLQVIVVDDGSTDRTAEIVRAFLSDNRFEYVYQENAGVSAAQSAGVTRAGGEFVAILGADDVWLPEKIERQVEMARGHPEAGLFFTNAMLFDQTGDIRAYYPDCYRFPEEELLKQLLVENPLCAGTVMIRTDLLGRHGAFDETLRVAEDYELWIRLAMAGVTAAGTMEILHRQRIRPDSLTRTRSAQMLREMIGIYRRSVPLLPDRRLKRLAKRSIRATRSNLMIGLARERLDRGHPRLAALRFVLAWLPKTSRRWLLGAALSCAVMGTWSKPDGRELPGWVEP